MTQSERFAFRELRNNHEVVIIEADKGSAVVLMNLKLYFMPQQYSYKAIATKKSQTKYGDLKKLQSARKQIIQPI